MEHPMASENHVSYNIMVTLQKSEWDIFQYHPPGGQAAWGIYVEGDLVFLDIVAYKVGRILIAENKGSFNRRDIEKLRRIINDPPAVKQIEEFVRDRCAALSIQCDINLQLIAAHGYSGKKVQDQLPDINLIDVSDNGKLTIIPSLSAPLTV